MIVWTRCECKHAGSMHIRKVTFGGFIIFWGCTKCSCDRYTGHFVIKLEEKYEFRS